MKRYALALDLRDDDELVAAYEELHRRVAAEIQQSIRDSGIVRMDIYRFANRLFMIMETDDGFSFARKAAADAADPRVQEWEELTWKYQQPIPGTKPGEKWVVMDKIFELSAIE